MTMPAIMPKTMRIMPKVMRITTRMNAAVPVPITAAVYTRRSPLAGKIRIAQKRLKFPRVRRA